MVPRRAIASRFVARVDRFSSAAPMKSARNWSEQIIRTLGRRTGASAGAARSAHAPLEAPTKEATAVPLRNARRLEAISFAIMRVPSMPDSFLLQLVWFHAAKTHLAKSTERCGPPAILFTHVLSPGPHGCQPCDRLAWVRAGCIAASGVPYSDKIVLT